MKDFLDLLKNTHFSVLLVSRTQENNAFNYNIHNRTALTADEVIATSKKLHYYNNVKSCDIYIKAEAGDFYNVVVDDLTKDKLNELLKIAVPDFVLFSSSNNYQAIFNLAKNTYSKAQADFLTKRLNERFGDVAFSGANHYFRLAGFYNKKQKNRNEKVELIEFSTKKNQGQTQNSEFFAELLADFKKTGSNSSNVACSTIEFAELTEAQQKLVRREVIAEIALCKKKFDMLDMSAVDFRIVKRLAKQHYTKAQIATAFELFTNYKNRHSNPADYLSRTINNAFKQI